MSAVVYPYKNWFFKEFARSLIYCDPFIDFTDQYQKAPTAAENKKRLAMKEAVMVVALFAILLYPASPATLPVLQIPVLWQHLLISTELQPISISEQ